MIRKITGAKEPRQIKYFDHVKKFKVSDTLMKAILDEKVSSRQTRVHHHVSAKRWKRSHLSTYLLDLLFWKNSSLPSFFTIQHNFSHKSTSASPANDHSSCHNVLQYLTSHYKTKEKYRFNLAVCNVVLATALPRQPLLASLAAKWILNSRLKNISLPVKFFLVWYNRKIRHVEDRVDKNATRNTQTTLW